MREDERQWRQEIGESVRVRSADARADAAVDASEAAQIMAIDKTFSDIQAQDPFTLRHPDSKKRHLKVVEVRQDLIQADTQSYDILPDDEAWANEYIMIRFPERPSAATAAVCLPLVTKLMQNPSASASSPRLSTAVLRPIIEEDQQIMEFYLPKEDDLVKLDLAHDEAVDAERLQQIADIVAEDGNDPRLDGIFPVSQKLQCISDRVERALRSHPHI
jgi:RNA polymerase II-associated factor 1